MPTHSSPEIQPIVSIATVTVTIDPADAQPVEDSSALVGAVVSGLEVAADAIVAASVRPSGSVTVSYSVDSCVDFTQSIVKDAEESA